MSFSGGRAGSREPLHRGRHRLRVGGADGIMRHADYGGSAPVSTVHSLRDGQKILVAGHLTHRGPDDQGYHDAPGIALGVRRLSIIDVPSGGGGGTVTITIAGTPVALLIAVRY